MGGNCDNEQDGEGIFDMFQRDPNKNPPKVRQLLSIYGDDKIIGVMAFRKPVQSYVITALNAISLGQFKSAVNSLGYDKLFHLGLKITSKGEKNGVNEWLIDKREVIKMEKWKNSDGLETITIETPSNLRISELFSQTQNYMGSKYGAYDSADNNCQAFIIAMLKANNMGNQEVYNWIKQDTEQLFERMPAWIRKFSRGVTDLASSANRLIEGEGHKINKYEKKQLLNDEVIADNPKLTAKQKLLLQVAKKSKLIS